jgi:SOS response regulatory protein OraA/RecX
LKGAPATREEAKKLFDYLIRRGFSYDLVIRKVREASKETGRQGDGETGRQEE